MPKNPPKNPNKPEMPEDSFNGNLTAIPKTISSDNINADPDLNSTTMDYGTMNLPDAIESGYTDKEGHAIDSQPPEVVESQHEKKRRSDNTLRH